MRTKAIKALTEKTGDERTSGVIWDLLVSKCFAGCEPSEAMFKLLDREDAFGAMPVGFRKPLAALWPDVPPEPAKGRKFKADNPRKYTAAEIVSFIAANPKTEGLREEYMRRTGGADALFYVDGKMAEAESADRIQRLFDRDPVAPFVRIGDRDVKPSGYPDDAPKEDKEDPYDPGTRLGQPGDVSERLGVSLADIGHETRQAIRCAVELDLADASTRELQADAAAAKGCSALVYLANKPKAYREWPTWKKPTLVMTRKAAPGPFAEPPAPTKAQREGDVARPEGWVPTIYVHGVDCNDSDWRKLDTQLALAVRAGHLRITSRRSVGFSGTVSDQLNRLWREADAMIVLVSAETFANPEYDAAVRGFDRPIVPVLLRACGWQRIKPLAQKQPIPASGKFLGATGEWAKAAEDILAFAATLRPRQAAPLRPDA